MGKRNKLKRRVETLSNQNVVLSKQLQKLQQLKAHDDARHIDHKRRTEKHISFLWNQIQDLHSQLDQVNRNNENPEAQNDIPFPDPKAQEVDLEVMNELVPEELHDLYLQEAKKDTSEAVIRYMDTVDNLQTSAYHGN